MRIVSTKLALKADFEKDDFYAILSSWFQENKIYTAVGELFMLAEDKDNAKVEAQFSAVETFTVEREGVKYLLFKVTHEYYQQKWTTEVIYRINGNKKDVIIHINCSGDITRFENVPVTRLGIIRSFVNSGKLESSVFPVAEKPLYLTSDKVEWLARVINGNYECELPLIFVSKIFNTAGYQINVDVVAQRLAGMAYVLAEKGDDFVEELRNKTSGRNPYNGHIRVYYKGGASKEYYERAGRGNSIDNDIIKNIMEYVTAQADKEDITWDAFYNERVAVHMKENNEMLDEALNENGSLAEQLSEAKEKIRRLIKENSGLNAQKDALKKALCNATERRLIEQADIPEFFDGEQYDLIVSALKKVLASYGEDSRAYELLNGILANNEIIGNGDHMEEIVKKVLSSGENPTERDFVALKAVGFEVVSDNNHYKLVYKGNAKYTFSLFKTASDRQRGGKNNVSDILKRLSVYR